MNLGQILLRNAHFFMVTKQAIRHLEVGLDLV